MSEMVMAPLIVSKPSDDKALVTITLRSPSTSRSGDVFCISHSWHDRGAILDVLVEVMVLAGLLEVWRDSAQDVAVVWADNDPPPPTELPRLPRVFVTDPWHPAALLSISAEAESVVEQHSLALIAVPLCRDRVARFVIAIMRQLKLRGLVLEAKDDEMKLWIDTVSAAGRWKRIVDGDVERWVPDLDDGEEVTLRVVAQHRRFSIL